MNLLFTAYDAGSNILSSWRTYQSVATKTSTRFFHAWRDQSESKPNAGTVSTPTSVPRPSTSLPDLTSKQASKIRKHPSRKQKHTPTLDHRQMVYPAYLDSLEPIHFPLLERQVNPMSKIHTTEGTN
ncbi:BZ3500_MvSof-1268-A1-R1_Chr5-2g07842 [Microbotryum saponariae]|uniref:BZ3500_MvSof-1268-A1-R1_Chr5-2g07842 protein n=1 Tax=Microbotryum saponariae TaxID=289078 RepID=A0A2X0LFK7_9BASI|nr:BZ3500_MvSof-1268-A1-R1_Chr5-2g07842 [Microbotryum saponariae]SDA05711.1 BZ3501_MvSof-1269-A2-R1_Chr5-2g07664 [Microbotryum saponariae]